MLDKEFIKTKIELIQSDLEKLEELDEKKVYDTVDEALAQYTKYCQYILDYIR